MAKSLIVLSVLVAIAFAGCHIPLSEEKKARFQRFEASQPMTSFPSELLWNDFNSTDFLTVAKNQHIPQYCGSCWAMAATSALSDRIKIQRGAAFPDVNIAPQPILECLVTGETAGCDGGVSIVLYDYVMKNGITDETCSIY
jgi:cathepsin X